MLRMLHGPRQRGTAHDTRKGHCTTTSWHRAREADLHGGPRMHDRMGDWMNRMEFLEPWRRIYAGPRVRSAHPVLHSRPAFACMAGSSESCTHSPEGNTPVAAVAATGCAPRGSGWSRGHDGSAAPSPLVWAAAWDMPGRTGLVRRSSPRASSRNDALASTITLRRALLRGQFAHEAWGYTLYSLYRTARGLRRWPWLRGTSAWRR